MENLWTASGAKEAIAAHAKKGIGEDLALRVYTTRLLGGEPKLVLHGGGNTSVKTQVTGLLGREAVRIVTAQMMGEAANVVYRDGQGNLQSQILFRDKEAELELVICLPPCLPYPCLRMSG